ncbi:Cell division protein FtsL [Marinobacterium lacunae]|uniref:Cell division protein FtsL n=1 Tax=Marinobacterium lacunae TaxID=1232683 RepID=A0A081G3N6_9GAMM|nr:cell division protein FtsL [Marinobacterium lacunae]KEA65391.1 Cell division protein FtsL [Marinobacterium lacunae]MBR9885591.1 cell division protein FtsL [Oceanospirillales bacterium]
MKLIRQQLERVRVLLQRLKVEPDASSKVTPERAETGRLLGATELARPAGVLFLMVALVLVSALMVIYSAYEYRNLFNQHQVLSSQGDDLQVEWGQLLLEESAWSANNRVEMQAEKKLKMRIPETQGIEIVRNEPR